MKFNLRLYSLLLSFFMIHLINATVNVSIVNVNSEFFYFYPVKNGGESSNSYDITLKNNGDGVAVVTLRDETYFNNIGFDLIYDKTELRLNVGAVGKFTVKVKGNYTSPSLSTIVYFNNFNINSEGQNTLLQNPLFVNASIDNLTPYITSVLTPTITKDRIELTFDGQDDSWAHSLIRLSDKQYMGITKFNVDVFEAATNQKVFTQSDLRRSASITGLKGYTSYTIKITATDWAGNVCTPITHTTTTAPPAPTSLSVSEITYSRCKIIWSKVDVATSYNIYNNGKIINSIPLKTTEYQVTGLTFGQNCNFTIKSIAANGVESEHSKNLNVVTLSNPTPVITRTTSNMCANTNQTITTSPVYLANSYTWTVNNGLTINGSNNNSYSVTTTSRTIQIYSNTLSGIGTVSVKANFTDNLFSNSGKANIWGGEPSTPLDIFGIRANQVFGSGEIELSIGVPDQGITNYQWTVSGGSILTGQNTNSITVYLRPIVGSVKRYLNISVKVANSCGWSNFIEERGFVGSGLSPLKSSEIIDENIISNTTASEDLSVIQSKTTGEVKVNVPEGFEDLYVFDLGGTIIYEQKLNNTNRMINIDEAIFKQGLYIVKLIGKDKTATDKFLITK